MQDHQHESKRGHREIQPRDPDTRNYHDIKEPEESRKNEEARLRQTDDTEQARLRNP